MLRWMGNVDVCTHLKQALTLCLQAAVLQRVQNSCAEAVIGKVAHQGVLVLCDVV